MKRSKANSGGVATEAGAAVLLQVHLWTGSAGAVPQQALVMVKDLLEVRGGELREASAEVVAASFGDAVLAVNAARNVQRMVQGFASEWKGGVLGGCTTLTRVDDAGGIEVGALRGSLGLEKMQPGQVVFVGELCDEARGTAGLELMPFVGARPMLLVGPPTRMDGYVDEPYVARVVEPVAVAPMPAPAPIITKPMGAVEGAPKRPGAAPVRRETPAVGAFAREEKSAGGGGLKRWGIVGGMAAAVVAGVLVFSPMLKKPKPVQVIADPKPMVDEPKPVLSGPVVTSEPKPIVEPKRPVARADGDGKHKPPPAVDSPAPSPHGITYSAAEIGSLIAHADKDSGDGNFEKAIQEYRIVLRQEPGNEAAKRGLARALRNQGSQ